jgi:hypothetical protein
MRIPAEKATMIRLPFEDRDPLAAGARCVDDSCKSRTVHMCWRFTSANSASLGQVVELLDRF